MEKNQLTPNKYILSTIHRNNNTDEPKRLGAIFEALLQIVTAGGMDLVLPLHPRTAKMLKNNLSEDTFTKLSRSERIKIIEPVSFLDMIRLEQQAAMIITDSGGVQKEAYFFKKPCIILRPETEWKEIVATEAAVIADADKSRIVKAWEQFTSAPPQQFPEIFGDGKAAEFICREMVRNA